MAGTGKRGCFPNFDCCVTAIFANTASSDNSSADSDTMPCTVQLQEALCAFRADPSDWAAYGVVSALGRRILAGQSPVAGVDELLPKAARSQVVNLFVENLHHWIASTETLEKRWYDIEDKEPWEADGLCQALLQLRLESWAVQAGLSSMGEQADEVDQAIDRFDTALYGQRETLCTIVDTNWYRNMQTRFPATAAGRPWVFGDGLATAAGELNQRAAEQMPSVEMWLAARFAAVAKEWTNRLPELLSQGALAAAPAEEPAAAMPIQLRWNSPDEKFVAHLNLPRVSNAEVETADRPVYIVRTADGELATELQGQSFRLGTFESTVQADGKVLLRLSDLRRKPMASCSSMKSPGNLRSVDLIVQISKANGGR